MAEEHLDIVKEIMGMALGSLGESLAQILEGHTVTLAIEKGEEGSTQQVLNEYPSGYLCVTFSLGGVLSGGLKLFFAQADAVKLAHIAMGMGGEESGEYTDFEKDVLLQAFQQSGEVLVSTIADFVEGEVKLVDTQILEEVPEEQGIILSGSFTLGDVLQSVFHCLLPEKVLAGMTAQPGESGASEAAVQAEQRETAEPEPASVSEGGNGEQTKSVATQSPADLEEKPVAQPVKFSGLVAQPVEQTIPNMDIVLDVPMEITVELGRAKKTIKDILDLSAGSIVELDKLEGEPVDILANGKLFAKGEVVVIGETFGVRVTEIVSSALRQIAE